MYSDKMKFEWNPDKNEILKKERNISFEKVIFHLSQGDVWKTTDHPDQVKFPGQKLYFILIENYVYIVPHIMGDEIIFLKTIIPSRKATKLFKMEQEENETRS
jgi:uncharacterized DUF497 family protein